MVQAANNWTTVKSVVHQISAAPMVALRLITNPLEELSALAQSRGTLVVDGLPAGATVEVDGIAVHPTPSIDTPLWVIPGTHTLRVLGPMGEELVRADVTVGPRQLMRWPFPPDQSGGDDGLSRNGWGLALLGGGTALAGGGAFLGWLSENQVEEVERLSRGPDKGAWEDGVKKGQALQLGANLSWIAAGILGGVGTYLLLTDGDSPAPPTEGGVHVTPSGLIIHW